jgi:two-component system OmpR family response regulator
MKFLIIEDDKSVAETVREWLTANMHTVEVATDGAEGAFLARSYDYDAIILDYSLPKKDGLVVCNEIRAAGKTSPILFLSATGDTDVKVAALESGADDYLTKPFELSELHARLRALTRRPHELKQPSICVGDLVLDTDKHTLTRKDRSIQLTRKEFGLIEYLMRNAGSVMSRALLMEHVWTADSDPFSNTVEAHIRNLRKKINAENNENMILNVPGRGYMLDTPANISKRK